MLKTLVDNANYATAKVMFEALKRTNAPIISPVILQMIKTYTRAGTFDDYMALINHRMQPDNFLLSYIIRALKNFKKSIKADEVLELFKNKYGLTYSDENIPA